MLLNLMEWEYKTINNIRCEVNGINKHLISMFKNIIKSRNVRDNNLFSWIF